jgi:hypothetical protein
MPQVEEDALDKIIREKIEKMLKNIKPWKKKRLEF